MDDFDGGFHDTETAIIETALDGIITIGADGIIRRCNPAAERLFGWTRAEVIGRNVKMLMPEPHHSRHDDYLAAYLGGGAPRIIGLGREVAGLRRDGSVFPMYLAVSEAFVRGERLFVGMVRDLTLVKDQEAALLERQEMLEQYIRDLEFTHNALEEQASLLAEMAERIDGERQMVVEAKRQVEHAAHHDSLTGLANRLYFNTMLRSAIERDVPFALLYLDLDKFKAVNDSFGHDAGDSLLRTVAERLTARVAGCGVTARLGGDEFAVLLDHDVEAAALELAGGLVELLRVDVSHAGQTITTGTSIGVAFFPRHGRESGSLVKAADQAMYESKKAGRNRYTVAT